MIIIGTPHTRNSGYKVNDQALNTKQEADIQTCPHCQAVIDMQVWSKAAVQNFCLKCMKPTCANAQCQECVPFLRKLEQYLANQLRIKAILRG